MGLPLCSIAIIVQFFAFLSILCAAQDGTALPESSECKTRAVDLTKVEADYGSLDAFYDIAQGMAKGLQTSLDDEYLKELADFWNGGFSFDVLTNGALNLIKREAGAIVFLIIGAIFVIGLPISGLIFCCCRMSGRCSAGGKHPKRVRRCGKWMLPIYLAMLTVSLIFIVTGMAIYGISIQNANDSLDKLEEEGDAIIKDVSRVMTAAASDVSCVLPRTVNVLFTNIEGTLRDVSNKTFSEFGSDYGYDDMKNLVESNANTAAQFDAALKSVANAETMVNLLNPVDANATKEIGTVKHQLTAMTNALTTLRNVFDGVYTEIKKTFVDVNARLTTAEEQVDRSINETVSQLDKSRDEVVGVTNEINKTVDTINQKITELNNKIKGIEEDVNTFSGRDAVVQGSKAIMLVPSALIVFPVAIVLIFGIIRILQNVCSMNCLARFTSIGGYVASGGLAFAFVLGWIVMLIASVVFAAGYGVETICLPLFRDDQMRIFKMIPDLSFNSTSNFGSTKFNLGDVLQSCESGMSIFGALHGENLMDEDKIIANANLDHYRVDAIKQFLENPVNYTVNVNTAELKTHLGELQAAMNGFDPSLPLTKEELGASKAFKDAVTALTDVQNKVNGLTAKMSDAVDSIESISMGASNSSKFASSGEEKINSSYASVVSKLRTEITRSKDDLMKGSFNCRPVYDVWENVGTVICDVVGRPLQGIWAAAGLAAVFFILAIAGLALTSGVLYQTERRNNVADHTWDSHEHDRHAYGESAKNEGWE